MKKCVCVVSVMVLMMLLSGCNMQMVDTTFYFDKAIIKLPDGTVIEGNVESWTDYEGEQIQVKIDDVTYVTHSENICLIADKEGA